MAKKVDDEEEIVVLFNKPISKEIQGKPPAVIQTGSPRPDGITITFAEITDLAKALKARGFDERAVVARDFKGKRPPFYSTMVTNWGIVKEIVTHKPNTEYKPIKVYWLDGTLTYEWDDDLILIHPAMAQYEVNQLIESRKKEKAV